MMHTSLLIVVYLVLNANIMVGDGNVLRRCSLCTCKESHPITSNTLDGMAVTVSKCSISR